MKRSTKKTMATEAKAIRRTAGTRKSAAASQSKTPTVITATIDVGFGNILYIRGDGPGMNWDEGTPMECVRSDEWTYTIEGAAKPVTFKFCLNNLTWCTGEDYSIGPGEKRAFAPRF